MVARNSILAHCDAEQVRGRRPSHRPTSPAVPQSGECEMAPAPIRAGVGSAGTNSLHCRRSISRTAHDSGPPVGRPTAPRSDEVRTRRDTSSHERRIAGQRHSARDQGSADRERRAPGDLHRAGSQSRARGQHLQGPGMPRPPRHAGRIRRHRAGPGGVSPRIGHRRCGRTAGPRRPGPGDGRDGPGEASTGVDAPQRHVDHGSGARRPGSAGAGHQGSARHQGRAPHHARVDSVLLPGSTCPAGERSGSRSA